MAGIRTCDRESQVQRPNHYTTEPPRWQHKTDLDGDKWSVVSDSPGVTRLKSG